MANAAPTTRWRLTVAEPFPVRCWEGDYVVYNSLSGDTHLLDIVSGHVLTRIIESPARASELRSRVAAFLEVPDDAAVDAQVNEILEALDDLGLIEAESEPESGC
jgi:PqqD family protein of HPr-rel-A system